MAKNIKTKAEFVEPVVAEEPAVITEVAATAPEPESLDDRIVAAEARVAELNRELAGLNAKIRQATEALDVLIEEREASVKTTSLMDTIFASISRGQQNRATQNQQRTAAMNSLSPELRRLLSPLDTPRSNNQMPLIRPRGR